MKVRFITFGCRLSRAEALEDEARFLADGWRSAGGGEEADVYVVRGCSVTARAQRDCEKTISSIRKRHPGATVLVRGCLPGRIDDSFRPVLTETSLSAKEKSASPEPLPARTARAYLKVQDGCSGKCTFCIVPKFRGKSRSVDFVELEDKAKRFIDAGYREIVVTGCNLSLYASHGKRLCDLLDALAAIDRNCRIRLGSLEPGLQAQETVHAIAQNVNICRFLHIPVQSGSDRILKAMQRPYASRDVVELTSKAASLMENVALGCDMMSGFPGENQADFNASLELAKECRFSNVHSFPYSERPGTVAASLPSPIPKQLRSIRAKQIAQTVMLERKKFERSFLGRKVEVLIEDEKHSAGWTNEYLWFESRRQIEKNAPKRREIATFTVTEIKNGKLYGTRVAQED